VVDFFSNNVAAITLVLAALCLLMIVMLQSLQVSRLSARIEQLTGGVEGGDLESVLGQYLGTVREIGHDVDELTARMAVVESAARHHFAREALVRFNPFPDTGGNQSFALALLDESEDGVVISSLHSRTGTRIYAKAVTAGKTDTSLSAEEQMAVDEARAKRAARPAAPPRSAAASRPAPAPIAAPAAAPAQAAGSAAADAPPPYSEAAAKAGKSAPAPAANSAPAAPAAPSQESTRRSANERVKGQEKPKNLPDVEVGQEVDPERVDRKPGQAPVSRPGPR
jgi:hypothetical protein